MANRHQPTDSLLRMVNVINDYRIRHNLPNANLDSDWKEDVILFIDQLQKLEDRIDALERKDVPNVT